MIIRRRIIHFKFDTKRAICAHYDGYIRGQYVGNINSSCCAVEGENDCYITEYLTHWRLMCERYFRIKESASIEEIIFTGEEKENMNFDFCTDRNELNHELDDE